MHSILSTLMYNTAYLHTHPISTQPVSKPSYKTPSHNTPSHNTPCHPPSHNTPFHPSPRTHTHPAVQRSKTRGTATGKSGMTLYMTDIFIRPHNSDRCNLVTHISSMDINNEEAMVNNGPSSMSTRKRKAVIQALKETYQVGRYAA